jgi:hypothetical protein
VEPGSLSIAFKLPNSVTGEPPDFIRYVVGVIDKFEDAVGIEGPSSPGPSSGIRRAVMTTPLSHPGREVKVGESPAPHTNSDTNKRAAEGGTGGLY